ncbi:MAG: diguanylate cyclase [Burkholderiaceae bacterium]|nr:diguanylate cyclase [Burkholderiaceae bacterium]
MNQWSTLDAFDDEAGFLAPPSQCLLALSDASGACEFVSPSWLDFTGRAFERETGAGWRELVHPHDRPALELALRQALDAQAPFRLQYRYLRADHSYRRLSGAGMVRRGPDGRFGGHVLQCYDTSACHPGEDQDGDGGADDEAPEHPAQSMIRLMRGTRLIAAVVDQQGCILFSNDSLCRALDYPYNELVNCALFERHLSPANRALLATLHPEGARAAHFPSEFESELLSRDGALRNILWHAIGMPDYHGHEHSTILIGDDVTEARRAEELLRLTARVYECTNQAMVVTDTASRIISVNQAFTRLTGYSEAEAIGCNPRILQSGRHEPALYQNMWQSIHATGHWHGDIWDRRKDGTVYPKFLSISAICDAHGVTTNYAGIFYDITERKQIEERLDFLAHYDHLTSLPNRSLFLDRMAQALERANRDQTRLGLLYLDLDKFKLINDTWGHAAGDAVLKAAAQRMKDCIRAIDTAARLGGDEFVLLLTDVDEVEALPLVAQKVLDSLSPPYQIDDHLLRAPPSIGISVYPDDHQQMEVLIKQADRAMYDAKSTRRGGYRFFHDLNSALPPTVPGCPDDN